MNNGTQLAPMNGAAMVVRRDSQSIEFTPEQRKMIRDSFASGASDSEFAVLMEVAKARNLNPITRQIHFVKRWDGQKKCEVWSTQISIDGLRALAERTGLYAGQDEPEFEYEKDGKIKLARVRVYRRDWTRPVVGVAHWAEYVQTTKEGNGTSMWSTKSHVMLSKCAEAQAMRKAFPEETSGLYVPEEMSNDAPPPQMATGFRAPSEPREVAGERIDQTTGEVTTIAPDAEALTADTLQKINACQSLDALKALFPLFKDVFTKVGKEREQKIRDAYAAQRELIIEATKAEEP